MKTIEKKLETSVMTQFYLKLYYPSKYNLVLFKYVKLTETVCHAYSSFLLCTLTFVKIALESGIWRFTSQSANNNIKYLA